MSSLKNKEKVFGKNRFVFAILKHPVLGIIIDAFVVKENSKGVFAYYFQKINLQTYSDHFDEISDIEKKGLEIIDNYSEEKLLKRFHREKIKIKDFLSALEKDFVEKHIRPFIDRNLYKLATLLSENDIPVFYKGGVNDRVKEVPVMINKNTIDVLFCFDKKPGHTIYSLKLYNNDSQINITDCDAEIIAQNPCLLLLGNEIYRFENSWDGKKLNPFLAKKEIVIPGSSEKAYYQKFVLNAVKNYRVQAKGFDIEYFNEEITPLLKLENCIDNKVAIALYFKYSDKITYPYKDETDNYTILNSEGENFSFLKLNRNRDKENEIASFLVSLGLKHKSAMHFLLDESKNLYSGPVKKSQEYQHLIDWLAENYDNLSGMGFIVEQDFSRKKFLTIKPVLDVSIYEKHDWFDLNINVVFGDVSIPFIKLKDNILKGEREYLLPNGEIALLPEEWFARFGEILKFGVKDSNSINLKRHHYTLLNNLDNGNSIANLHNELKFTDEIPIPQISANLRPYQKEGYQWINFLHNNGFGGVLADDMGLGKTLQALTMLLKLYHPDENELAEVNELSEHTATNATGEGHCNSGQGGVQLDIFHNPEKNKSPASLIVMPLSLIHNWTREIMRFTPSLRVYQHIGVNRITSTNVFDKYDVILTTYGTLRNDINTLKEYCFYYVILDESQIIKNAGSKAFQAVKALNSKHRLVLTGTPIENSLKDLWSQFSFLNPGMLGSFNFFRDEYVNPIEKDNNVLKKEKLQRIINPFILRRTKDEVEKDLPELTEMMHYCEMTDEQESFYEEKKSEVRNFIIERINESGIDKSRFHILSGLMSLRLIANHPVMASPDYKDSSGKYIEIVRSIDKLLSEGHKALIFSQFVKHLNLIRSYLDSNGLEYSFLTGNTPEKERKLLINEFQNNAENKLFLISLKAGGVGLNLTGADYVFLLDPWWNPAVENQAINRAHRIGQDKKVFVYKFITRNTVEEKIINLQQQKSELAGMIINSNNPLKSLKPEQLEGLL